MSHWCLWTSIEPNGTQTAACAFRFCLASVLQAASCAKSTSPRLSPALDKFTCTAASVAFVHRCCEPCTATPPVRHRRGTAYEGARIAFCFHRIFAVFSVSNTGEGAPIFCLHRFFTAFSVSNTVQHSVRKSGCVSRFYTLEQAEGSGWATPAMNSCIAHLRIRDHVKFSSFLMNSSDVVVVKKQFG